MDLHLEHKATRERALGKRSTLAKLRYRQLTEVTQRIIAADVAAKLPRSPVCCASNLRAARFPR